MNKLKSISVAIILIGLGIGGYFIYKNYQSIQKYPDIVEINDTFLAIDSGAGIGPYAKCPAGKRPTGGTCWSASSPTQFIVAGSELTKSNLNLEYNDAWTCYFTATAPGTYSYKISVSCE
jgi:hypothetical protein